MAHWVTLGQFSDPSEYAVQAARLRHEGIAYRVVQAPIWNRRRGPEMLLQVSRSDAMIAAKLLGLPVPLLDPEPPLTGLGFIIHRAVEPVLTFVQRIVGTYASPRNVALTLLVLGVLLVLILA